MIGIVFTSLSGCGLPQYTYLAPVVLDSVDTGTTVIAFTHDQANDVDGFSGYDLYYKFYNEDTTTSTFSSDRTKIETALPGNVTTTLTALEYRRATRTDSVDQPTIPINAIERASDFIITIQFQFGAGDPAKQAQIIDTPQLTGIAPFLRANDVVLSGEKGFRPGDIVPGDDADVPPTTSPTIVHLGIAIVAMGINFETFNRIYSSAIVASGTANEPLELNYQ